MNLRRELLSCSVHELVREARLMSSTSARARTVERSRFAVRRRAQGVRRNAREAVQFRSGADCGRRRSRGGGLVDQATEGPCFVAVLRELGEELVKRALLLLCAGAGERSQGDQQQETKAQGRYVGLECVGLVWSFPFGPNTSPKASIFFQISGGGRRRRPAATGGRNCGSVSLSWLPPPRPLTVRRNARAGLVERPSGGGGAASSLLGGALRVFGEMLENLAGGESGR
uniref:Uncharacterized protein n=1 Tax=Oryza rufipogon TaxID=4529 RepID=A0A0E0NA04_ORYRU